MNKIAIVFVLLLLPLLAFANAIPNHQVARPLYAPNIVKVQLTPSALSKTHLPEEFYAKTNSFGLPELDRIMSQYGTGKVIRAHIRLKDAAWEKKYGVNRWFLVKFTSDIEVAEAVDAFRANKYVETAIPEYYAYTQVIPNDPLYPNNWGHNNTAQLPFYTGGSHSGAGVGTIGFDSNAQAAWDDTQGYGSASTIIAIIDTGVDITHPDLRLVTGYDYGNNDSNPMDDSADPGHGTACSGIAAGIGNNGIGVAGMAPGCSIMPLKIAANDGTLGFTAIENALYHAGNNNVDVASMSFGASMSVGSSPSTDTALAYAYSHGVVLLAATANDNASTISYPAKYPNVIAVGASSPTGQRKNLTSSDGENWWGSNYGVNTQNSNDAVDVMAPTILPATDIVGGGGYDSGNYSMWFNGTSCATPYAAGVAALILSKSPSLTPAQVFTAMTSTATDMTFDGGAGWDRYTGYGLVNAQGALASLTPGLPSCTITAPAFGTVYNLGDIVTVNVTATDTAPGSINRVDFYLDGAGTPTYTDSSSPYSWAWNTTGTTGGNHTIEARAVDNEANTASSSVTIAVLAPADEGFETGNFTAFPWVQSGNLPWTVQSTEHYSGNYAAKSGAITDNQTSTMAVSMNITAAGNITFFQKTSSEATYDFLYFYIDSVQQGSWSGEVPWTMQSYAVTTGTHEFKWTYSKDGSVSTGSDAAFVDHITFPPTTILSPPVITWNPTSFTQTLATNSSASQNLSIGNTGEQTLNYTASLPVGTPTTVLDETFATTTIPTGWTQVYDTGTTAWVFIAGGYNGHPATAYDGTYNARLYQGSTTAAVTKLVTPALNLSGATSSTLTFWHTQELWSLDQDELRVYYRTTSTGTWTLLTTYTASIATWTQETITLPNLTGTYYIGFQGTAKWGYGVCIDKVVVTKTGTSTPWLSLNSGLSVNGSITSGGANNTISVGFNTTGMSSGTYNSTITVTSNSTTNSTVTIPVTLTVAVLQPNITVNPVSIPYGTVLINTTASNTFTIANSGNALLTGTITTPAGYSVSLQTAAAGAMRENTPVAKEDLVAVPFMGKQSAEMVAVPFMGTQSVEMVAVPFTGTQTEADNHFGGIKPPATMMLKPQATVTNDLQSQNSNYSQRNVLSFNVTAGNTNTYNLVFAPTAVQAYNGNVVITHNAGGGDRTIALTGQGGKPTLVRSANTFTANLAPGQTNSQTLNISNTGNMVLNYSLTISGTPAWLTINGGTTLSSSIAVGGAAQNITIACNSAGMTPGTYNATINGTSNDPVALTYSITVTLTVRNPITVTSPAGGEAWQSGTAHNITWNYTGAGTTVELLYSINGGSTYTSLGSVASVQGANSYSWSIPYSPSVNCIVRVRDSVSPNVTVNSGVFSIITPAITVNQTALAFGTVLINTTTTQSFNIANSGTATLTGNITTPSGYSVALARSAESTFSAAPDGVRNVLSYSIPAGTNANFTVTFAPVAIQAYNGNITITHNASGGNKIIALTGQGGKPVIGMNSTAFSANLAPGQTNSQTLTVSNTGNMALNYSLTISGTPGWLTINGTTTVSNTIAIGGAAQNITLACNSANLNPGTYNAVINGTSNDPDNPVYNINVTLTVRNPITVTSPIGGEAWQSGTTQTINFDYTGAGTSILLYYSTNGGTSYSSLGSVNTVQGANSFSWSIPYSPTANGLLRLRDTISPFVLAYSGTFSIITPAITVDHTSMAYGTVLINTTTAHTFDIANAGTATLSGNITTPAGYSVALARSAEGTFSASPDGDRNVLAYSIPAGTNANFSVTFAPTAIQAYNGNITITHNVSGANKTIALTGQGGKPVIGLSATSFSANLAPTQTGTQTLTISNTGNMALNYSLSIISPPSWLTINGGTTVSNTIVNGGTAQNITLAFNTGVLSPGVYNATIHGTSNDPLNLVYDITVTLTVRTPITITSPAGGEVWQAGSLHNISWNYAGLASSVDLFYTTDGGINWLSGGTLSTVTGSNSYGWVVMNPPTTEAMIRLVDGEPPFYTANSNVFTITAPATPLLTITSPNGGEQWITNTIHNITWTSSILHPQVRLSYSPDNGTTWTDIATVNAANLSYSWTTPTSPTGRYLVAIHDAVDAEVYDISDAVFAIYPPAAGFHLTAPNGGESWHAFTEHNITWSTTYPVQEIYYSVDNGASWILDATNPAGFTSPYLWTVPDNVSNQVRVQIKYSDPVNMIFLDDMSDAVFSIVPIIFHLNAPNGGEVFTSGSVVPISWTTEFPVQEILFSANNGATWSRIIYALGGIASPYNWTVPNVSSTQCLIKIHYENMTSTIVLNDVSDAVFTINNVTPPAAPLNVTITQSLGNVTLSWGASSGNPTGYLIYQSNTPYFLPADTILLGTRTAAETSFVIPAAEVALRAFYRVVAYRE